MTEKEKKKAEAANAGATAEGATGGEPAAQRQGQDTGAEPAAQQQGQNTDGGQTQTVSKKDSYMKGFRERHPDWQDDDEEGFYGRLADQESAMNEERESWNKEREGYQKNEKEVIDALAGGGVLNAALFSELLNGTPIPLALVKRYPDEIKAWLDDPKNTDKLEKIFKEHADAIKKNRELEEESANNLEETNAMINEMLSNGELNDEAEVNELLGFLGQIAIGLMMNHVEKDWLMAAKKAMNHDADVEAAKTQGEIDGRNQKISEQRMNGQRGGNTHATLGSGNAGQRLTRRQTEDATGAGGRKSMWDGMKTNKLN